MHNKLASKILPQQVPSLETTSVDLDKESWEPWSKNGPMLRIDSFTAGQLACLQPEAMHIESRSELIGDFPPNWVESHCSEWMQAVSNYMDSVRRDSDSSQKPTTRNINRQRRLVDLNLADRIACETQSTIRNYSSKRERLRKEMQRRRNRFRKDQLAVIAHQEHQQANGLGRDEDSSDDEQTNHPNHEPESSTDRAPESQFGDSRSYKSGRSGDTASFQTALEQPDESLHSSHHHTAHHRHNSSTSHREQELSSIKSLKQIERKDINHHAHKLKTRLHGLTITSAEPEGHQPQTKFNSNNTLREKEDNGSSNTSHSSTLLGDTKAAQNPQRLAKGNDFVTSKYPEGDTQSSHVSTDTLHSIEPLTTSEERDAKRSKSDKHTHGKQPSASGDQKKEKKDSQGKSQHDKDENRHVKVIAPVVGSDSMLYTRSTDRFSFSTMAQRDKSRWHHIPFTKVTSHGPKIYQGRFLVQERRSRALCPVVNEYDAPLSTSLVTRWKECAVHARRNEDSTWPLTLYFYKSTNMRQNPWTLRDGQLMMRDTKKLRGLEYKVRLDRNYRVAFFSPLDLTLAIWRPRTKHSHHHHHHYKRPHNRVGSHLKHRRLRKKGYNGNNTSYYTQVLIIHAQSVTAIMDLAYLISSATGSAPLLYGPSTCTVDIPSINVKAQIGSIRECPNLEKMNEIGRAKRKELLPYSELTLPAVSIAPAGKKTMEGLWKMIETLPRRFAVSRLNENAKFALAWVMEDIARRPLWLPSATTSVYPVNRLNFLVNGKAKLVVAQPLPKCYLGDRMEPPAVEGYCRSTDLMANAIIVQKRLTYQTASYLFTSDCYLMCLPANQGEPSMLASSQNGLVKQAEPFPLDKSGQHIDWILKSTCLAEIDRRDAMAKLELDRKTRLISKASGFINLLHYNTFEVVHDSRLRLSSDQHPTIFHVSFDDAKIAQLWCEKLKEIAQFWQDKFQAWAIKRMAGVEYCNYTITSFLHNRPIVYNGPLFMKQHRFASFKSYHVILTAAEMVVFRIGKALRAPAHPQQTVPAASLNHHRVANFDLRFTYIYSGQAASHVLLGNDTQIDSGNPGERALPRSYEHGWISADTELDRCFVLWRAKESRSNGLSSPRHKYIAFLAPEKNARDEWVTAIRNVQTQLQLISNEEDEDATLHLQDEDEDEQAND